MTDSQPSETDKNQTRLKQVKPPAPESVSEQARRFLNVEAQSFGAAYPAASDTAAWLALAETMDAAVGPYLESLLPPADTFVVSSADVGPVKNYVIRPSHVDEAEDLPVFIEIHGGALYLGQGELAWMAAAPYAVGRGGITWAPDYRLPPTDPYPAALDDVLAVYKAAIADVGASRVVVSGSSAGGNLAAALLVRARDEGLPMPAALVLISPELDLTESGDSFATNNGIDALESLMAVNELYANGVDLRHPYVSPLFADVTGFPPTFLQTGTRDVFLSNTVRMHRHLLESGVETELHVFEAMPHGGFGGTTPEDAALAAEIWRFEAVHLSRRRGSSADLAHTDQDGLSQ
ncbi:alpha/beta hydrolase [Microbacterium sp. LMI1-1-1.1]|uniref:alpha/beta hydrolase n=1 Tax=Microbacterium sp. LMI1-1-1.1 TaxID=3135223 RepID=UPI003467351A